MGRPSYPPQPGAVELVGFTPMETLQSGFTTSANHRPSFTLVVGSWVQGALYVIPRDGTSSSPHWGKSSRSLRAYFVVPPGPWPVCEASFPDMATREPPRPDGSRPPTVPQCVDSQFRRSNHPQTDSLGACDFAPPCSHFTCQSSQF